MKAGTHQVNTSFTRKISLLAGAVALSGCATLNDAGKNYGTAIGCAGGALLGAGLTYAITGDAKKAIVGGGVGAAAGCVAGNLWQNRLQELERIAKEENLNILTAASMRSLFPPEIRVTVKVVRLCGLPSNLVAFGRMPENGAKNSA